MRKLSSLLFSILLIACSKESTIRFELPSVISDGMVLQRDTEVVLWGKASPKQSVKIVTNWGIRKRVKTDENGKWQLKIKTGPAGGPYEVAFQTSDTSVIIKNVLLGEVWICSGQSNMEMPMAGWPPNDTIMHSAQEIAGADYPQIRLFTVPRKTAIEPLDNCIGSWSECSPESVAGFSATAYLFGKNIYQKLGVPVGLIHTSWGGTPAEAWTSKEFLNDFPAYKTITDSFQVAKVQYQQLMDWMKTLDKIILKSGDDSFYSKIDLKGQEFIAPGFDDSNWPVMSLPAFWEQNALPEFDGIVWFRKTFEIPASMSGKEMILHLGPIDDMDITYLNGGKIGDVLRPGFWKESRDYVIPADKVKAGKNTLAVCVIDNMGGGGLYGPEDITLTIKGTRKSMNLSGEWKYMPVAEIIGSELYYYSTEKPYTSRPVISIPVGQNTPSVLFNGMINPLVPYTIKGAIWYQGEANVGKGYEYRKLFPAMINSWRSAWDQGDFPFYYVQIAPWEYGDEPRSAAAEVREAQLMTLAVPHTGMAVVMDIGNPKNIHPCNKEDVGKRLSLWALAKDYGYDTITYSGPLYDTIRIDGNKVIVLFEHVDGGLVARGGDLTYFELAGEDQAYYPAEARIVDETVVVTSPKVPAPVAVRYGWSATAEPNLFNAAGLPASPFRSDNWKRLSEY